VTRINITYLKALNCAASTEKETRFYLCGVLVECRERSVTYAATDGHVLLSAHDALDDEADANAVLGDFIIPSDAIAKMKLSKRAQSDFETMTQGPDGTLILCGQAFKPIDGTFPDWRRVLPKGGETNDAGKPPNHYDPPVAMRLHKATEIVNGRRTNALMRICPAPEGYPAAVELPCGTLPWFGVIMPIRCDDTPWHRPDWISTSVETQPVLQAAE
jgi:hypothetical protein